MGIDKSLTDDFPSVVIDGTRYHYGRENRYGQYLVENAEYAKDNWCFDRKDDLLAFLVMLPESAESGWIERRHPDWSDVTYEKRTEYLAEHRAFLRGLAEEKRKAGTADCFNVLCFNETTYYDAFADPGHWSFCDDVVIQVREQEVSKDGRKEFLIELNAETRYGQPEKGTFKIWRKQALKLADCLLKAAVYIEEQSSEDRE